MIQTQCTVPIASGDRAAAELDSYVWLVRSPKRVDAETASFPWLIVHLVDHQTFDFAQIIPATWDDRTDSASHITESCPNASDQLCSKQGVAA